MERLEQSESEHWRQRADQARRAGDHAITPGGKLALYEVAESYDDLAAVLERLERTRLVKRASAS